MNCKKCGKEIESGVIFCPFCGEKQNIGISSVKEETLDVLIKEEVQKDNATKTDAEQTVETEEKPAGKESNKKLSTKILMAAGFIVVLLFVIFFVKAVKSASANKNNIGYIGYEYVDGNETSYLWNKEGEVCEIEDEIIDADYAAEDCVMAFLVLEGNTHVLYYTKKDLDVQYVDEDVEQFSISSDGKYICYIKDVNEDYTSGDLYIYDIKKEKERKIDNHVYPYYVSLSPNGKYVAYLRNYESNTDNVLYLAGIQKEPEKIDKDGAIPLGVMNNGKNLYYVTDNDKLYFYDDDDSKKISSHLGSMLYFNNDLTEVIFVEEGDTYYYTSKMDEPKKVCKHEFYNVFTSATYVGTDIGIAIKDSLKNSILITELGIYWFDKEGEDTHRITSNADLYMTSENEKKLVYLDDGKIYIVDKFGDDIDPKCVFDKEEANKFVISKDLSRIYAVAGNELYYVKNAKKAELITDELEENEHYNYSASSGSVAYCENQDKIFFIEDGVLYSAGTKKNSKKEIAEDVVFVYQYCDTVCYYTEDADGNRACYLVKKDENVKLFAE